MFISMFLDLMIKVSLLFGVVAVIDAVWRNASAAVRHRLWTCACLVALVLPFASLALPQYRVSILPDELAGIAVSQTTSFETGSHHSSAVLEPAPKELGGHDSLGQANSSSPLPNVSSLSTQDNVVGQSSSANKLGNSIEEAVTLPAIAATATDTSELADRFSRWLLLIWVAGASAAYWPWLMGRRFIRTLQRNSSEIHEPDFQQELLRWCRRLGIRSSVRVLQSSAATTPMTWGILSPTIMFPANWREWPRGAWQAALLHELAHIQRRDLLCQWIARLTCAVYWFHPLAWHAARRLKVEREMACDDCVILQGQTASDYATHLVAIAKGCLGRIPSAAISMAPPTGLEQRVRALLDSSRSHHPISRSASMFTLAAIVLLTIPLISVQASLKKVQDRGEAAISGVVEEQGKAADDGNLEIAGTVVGPDGQPVEGAKLFMVHSSINLVFAPDLNAVQAGTSLSDGSFSFQINPRDFNGVLGGWSGMFLVATKNDYGLAGDGLFLFEKSGQGLTTVKGPARSYRSTRWKRNEPKLCLTNDHAPVEGRLLDSEGRPLQGAKVTLMGLLGGSPSAMDEWEAEAVQGNEVSWILGHKISTPPENVSIPSARIDSVVPPVVTDVDGKFEMRGLGSARLARLAISHPYCEHLEIQVRTRDGATLRTEKEVPAVSPTGPRYEMERCYPRQFEVSTARSIPIIGTITDSLTGEPIKGALVATVLDPVVQTGSRAVTDENGRYELHGFVERSDGSSRSPDSSVVTITPPVGSPYFPMLLKPQIDLKQPHHQLDIRLLPGIFVRGKVRNKSTGEPVIGTVFGGPLADNSNAARYLEADSVLKVSARTDQEGNFAVPAIPGKFRLGFRAEDSDAFVWFSPTDPSLPSSPLHYAKEIEVDELDGADHEIQLFPAKTIEIQVLDRTGNPASEVDHEIVGFRNSGTHVGSSFFVQLNRRAPEEFVVYDCISGDAGVIVLSPEVVSPVTLRLAPTATIRGRVVDHDGLPKIAVAAGSKHVMPRYQRKDLAAGKFFLTPHTDIDGRFEMIGLVGYQLQFRFFGREGQATDLVTELVTVRVNSTAPIELGDITFPQK